MRLRCTPWLWNWTPDVDRMDGKSRLGLHGLSRIAGFDHRSCAKRLALLGSGLHSLQPPSIAERVGIPKSTGFRIQS